MEENIRSGKVNIDKDFYIRLEDRSFVLCQSRVSKGEKTKGQEVEDVIGYFSTLDSVFNRYFKEQVIARSIGLNMDLKEFNVLLKEIKEDIKAIRKVMEV